MSKWVKMWTGACRTTIRGDEAGFQALLSRSKRPSEGRWVSELVRTRQNSTALNCSTQRGTPKGSLPPGISIGNDQNQNLVDQDPWNISSSDICKISTKSQRDHIKSNHSMIISESFRGSESLKPPLRAYLWGWQCGRHTALLRSARQRSRMASRRKLGLTPAGWSNTVR